MLFPTQPIFRSLPSLVFNFKVVPPTDPDGPSPSLYDLA